MLLNWVGSTSCSLQPDSRALHLSGKYCFVSMVKKNKFKKATVRTLGTYDTISFVHVYTEKNKRNRKKVGQTEIYTRIFSVEENLEAYLPKCNQRVSVGVGAWMLGGNWNLHMFFSVPIYYLNNYKQSENRFPF